MGDDAKSAYSAVDPVIHVWAEKHSLKLCKQWDGWPNGDARFTYVSSSIDECFQIAIEQPKGRQVVLLAGDIEIRSDESLRTSKTFSELNLSDGVPLDAKTRKVRYAIFR